jgi:predicted nucleic acid-binding protein
VLIAWERRAFQWVISNPVLDEYRRVLAELGARYPGVKYDRILELITVHAEAVAAVQFARPVCKDRDEDKFLGTAQSAGAQFVVTGDKLLLAVDGFRGLRVVPPKTSLKVIASR